VFEIKRHVECDYALDLLLRKLSPTATLESPVIVRINLLLPLPVTPITRITFSGTCTSRLGLDVEPLMLLGGSSSGGVAGRSGI